MTVCPGPHLKKQEGQAVDHQQTEVTAHQKRLRPRVLRSDSSSDNKSPSPAFSTDESSRHTSPVSPPAEHQYLKE